MKALASGAIVLALALTLTACNGGGQAPADTAGESAASQTVEAGTPEAVLEDIQADFNDTAQNLYDEQEKMFESVGDSYEDYKEHKDQVQDWYNLAVSETEALGERVQENSRVYFQAVIDTVDLTDEKAIEDAIDAYFEAIYEDAYDDYYDAVYEDAFDAAYDQYYDGILSDAIDADYNYSEVSELMSAEYKACADARSDVYEAIADARSAVYEINSDAWSAFYDDEFTMDEIFRESVVDVQADGDSSSEDNGDADDTSAQAENTSGVSADFKATMDEYEAFFNEYVDFMNAYSADPSSSELLARYSDMMAQYSEVMAALEGIDEDSLSTDDYVYYTEVMARITAKLAEVGQ